MKFIRITNSDIMVSEIVINALPEPFEDPL